MLHPILAKTWDMELQQGPYATIRGLLPRSCSVQYLFDARFAVAENRAAGMPRRFLARSH